MNWFRLRVDDGSANGYTYTGSTPDSFETLAEKAARGEFIRLDELLYDDRGELKAWAEWDKRLVPSVYVRGSAVVAIHPFKADPRTLPK